MSTLTIQFRGVCSHYRGVVPGVPHRVVLPDASATRVGYVQIGEEKTPRLYALMPHVPRLIVPDPDEQKKLTIKNMMVGGYILNGVRLQIMNAIKERMDYDGTYLEVPQLTNSVPDFNFSSEVVLGGRAGVYFDVFGGKVAAERVPTDPSDGAMQTNITIETDGTPRLMVTPFLSYEQAGASIGQPDIAELSYWFDLNTDVLCVVNQDLVSFTANYDFLWHYTASKGGIPNKLSNPTPGMPTIETLPPEADFIGAMQKAASEYVKLLIMAANGEVSKELVSKEPPDLEMAFSSPSCSDSRFP